VTASAIEEPDPEMGKRNFDHEILLLKSGGALGA
jgi:hypothetical protein